MSGVREDTTKPESRHPTICLAWHFQEGRCHGQIKPSPFHRGFSFARSSCQQFFLGVFTSCETSLLARELCYFPANGSMMLWIGGCNLEIVAVLDKESHQLKPQNLMPSVLCPNSDTNVGGSVVQNPPADATHSSVLAWEMPWTQEPGGLRSVAAQAVMHECLSTNAYSM